MTLLAALVAALWAMHGAHAADVAKGPARVISGDVLEIAGERFRLHAIDAPEAGQNCAWRNTVVDCGRIAATGLMDLVVGAEVRCRRIGKAGDGTGLAKCDVDGFDLSQNMVYTGWALALPGAPAALATTQAKSRAARRGMWRGAFIAPWDWRRGPDEAAICVAGRAETGGPCPALRADGGAVHALSGLTGALADGTRACLCGRAEPQPACTGGPALRVSRIRAAGWCR